MKKLILNTLIFISPFIFLTIFLENKIREIPNDYEIKSKLWEQKADSIEILILGSSHGVIDINPVYFTHYAFNAAHTSQSLDVDLALLKKYSQKLKSIKYIVLPISYHTLSCGSLNDGIEDWRASYYNIYYQIRIENNPLKTMLIFDGTMQNNLKRLRKYYTYKIIDNVHIDNNGFQRCSPADNLQFIEKDAILSVKRHTVIGNNKLFENSLNWLNQMIQLSEELNCKVILFTPPCHKSYRDLVDTNQLNKTISKLESLKDDKNVFYYNYMNWDDVLSTEDYYDSNHLSYLGAEKLTLKLNEVINDIENQDP